MGIWNKRTYLEIIDEGKGNHAFKVKESDLSCEGGIEAISIDDLISDFQIDKIDILKIDIEGSEEQVFLSDPKWIRNVSTIFCEIHENMKPGLTQKIESILSPYFNIAMNGEYHVFKRR